MCSIGHLQKNKKKLQNNLLFFSISLKIVYKKYTDVVKKRIFVLAASFLRPHPLLEILFRVNIDHLLASYGLPTNESYAILNDRQLKTNP